jgi:hypothetical protein
MVFSLNPINLILGKNGWDPRTLPDLTGRVFVVTGAKWVLFLRNFCLVVQSPNPHPKTLIPSRIQPWNGSHECQALLLQERESLPWI